MRLLSIGALLLLSGCTGILRSLDLGGEGSATARHDVRSLLEAGEFDQARQLVADGESGASGDVLLTALDAALVAHYAGRYDESNVAFESAHRLAEARETRSISRGLLSLISTDRVLPYVPDRTERLLLHYYAALNYLSLDQPGEAAVEARRMLFALDRHADELPLRDHPDVAAHLHRVAGLVFEAAGESNEAAVAYRRASGRRAPADTAAADPDPLFPATALTGVPMDSGGEVVVLIERGFVAHRTQVELEMALWSHELEALDSGPPDARADAATCLAGLVLRAFRSGSPGGRLAAPEEDIERCVPPPREEEPVDRSDEPAGRQPIDVPPGGRVVTAVPRQGTVPPAGQVESPPERYGPGAAPARGPNADADANIDARATGGRGSAALPPPVESHLVRMALPMLRSPPPASPWVTLLHGNGETVEVVVDVALSECIDDEFEADAAFVVAKTIIRAATRYAFSRGIEAGVGELDSTLGEVVGFLADAAGGAVESADTRSWHLLPHALGATRVLLPPGTHSLAIAAADEAARCDFGPVSVTPGERVLLSCRLWR